MQKLSIENLKTRLRAPKATSVQVKFLLSYMETHNALATGKLLRTKGRAAHDAQWQQLTEKLNNLNGPSKSMNAWKKLWCDQRNQARARVAKGKAQQKLTSNIGKQVNLKDSDLRILSIIGDKSSVGLPIMEVGVGKQLEAMVENLHRIASAVEKQNNLLEKSLGLHTRTLEILAATLKNLTGKM